MKFLFLNDFHASKGAKFSPFADWSMPIYYKGALEEHLHTRKKTSIFDVSHMGEIVVEGKDASKFLNQVLTNNAEKCPVGRGIYSPMCGIDGGTVDDLICYRKSHESFLLCVNASNILKDHLHFLGLVNEFDCSIQNLSDKFGQLAIQGPLSESLLTMVFGEEVTRLKKRDCLECSFKDQEIFLARTGYTGEDGFEIYVSQEILLDLALAFDQFCDDGSLAWAGLAARDTLRLEAGFPLYGHELSDKITPLQAGLDWCIDWEKDQFEGRDALLRDKQSQEKAKVFFFEVFDRRIPRKGANIVRNGQVAGRVLSGGYSPCLQIPIGSALVNHTPEKNHDSEYFADVRGSMVPINFCQPLISRVRSKS